MLKNIIIIALLIMLIVTIFVYVNMTYNMNNYQKERLAYALKKEKEIKNNSVKLIDKQVCNEKLQTCTTQLNKNNNAINEIKHVLVPIIS
jgi:uncharacterized membrane protein affecting hemolysin expression